MASLAGLLRLCLLGTFANAAIIPGQYNATQDSVEEYEYIVVGSGAGGGPVASRLALAGHTVLLIDAGQDEGNRSDYRIPAWFNIATEDPDLSWGFYTRQYDNDTLAFASNKAVWQTPDGSHYVGNEPPPDSAYQGIWYPRVASLGGCTAHNWLIAQPAHGSDWKHIQKLTGDSSWDPDNMRRYFERLERNQYLPPNREGHGYDGWLATEWVDRLSDVFGDWKVVQWTYAAAKTLQSSLLGSFDNTADSLQGILQEDINRPGPERDGGTGMYQVVQHSDQHIRSGTREFILDTIASGAPLTFMPNTLVTKIVFDHSSDSPTATGVEFLQGKSLYKADPRSTGSEVGTPGSVRATREVIISGGVFNTPQLLKLSGIGPRAELEQFDIPVVVDLPGVGVGLQDRYEQSVLSQTTPSNPFTYTANCTGGAPDDPCLERWENDREDPGPYGSNGFVFAITMKSSVVAINSDFPDDDDLFIVGAPGGFIGWFPGFSTAPADSRTWLTAVLKAHTRNTAGTVNLKSANPRDTPDVNFHYFEEGTTANNAAALDLQAVVEGMEFARNITNTFNSLSSNGSSALFNETYPGIAEYPDSTELANFARLTSYGHHASCTCAIGADGDPMAVLDGDFKVRGTKGLRVVDASAFPRIPGWFIVVPTMMLGEKAADVILAACD